MHWLVRPSEFMELLNITRPRQQKLLPHLPRLVLPSGYNFCPRKYVDFLVSSGCDLLPTSCRELAKQPAAKQVIADCKAQFDEEWRAQTHANTIGMRGICAVLNADSCSVRGWLQAAGISGKYHAVLKGDRKDYPADTVKQLLTWRDPGE